MEEPPLIIEERPRGFSGRLQAWIRGRRLMLVAALVLIEIIAYIIWRPGLLLAMLAGIVILILAVSGATRVRPGPLRDLLWIVAWAQAILVAVPLLLGASILIGVILIAGLIILLLTVLLRGRR